MRNSTKKLKNYLLFFISILLVFSLSACNTEKPSANNEQNGENKESVEISNPLLRDYYITYTYDFRNGVSWIEFKKDKTNENERNIALINSKGKILYSQENARVLRIASSGHGIVCDNITNVYSLINEKGTVVCDSNSNLFDRLLAFGDDNILVYKFSGPKDSKHLYATIDFKGNLIDEYFEVDYDAAIASYKRCGIFHIGDDLNGCILNPSNKKVLWLEGRSPSEFVDNKGYLSDRNNSFYIETSFLVDTNFEVATSSMPIDEKESFDEKIRYTYDYGYMTTYEADGKYFIRDMKTNKSYEITGYSNCNLSASFKNNENYGELWIKTEGRYYFTMIDKEGKEQFEPIEFGGDSSFGNGYIIYEELTEGYFSIADYKGNILAEKLEYESIKSFSESGVAWAKGNDEYYHCINSKGEELF